MLAERGVNVSIATLWRFFARHGITRKKDRARDRAGSPRRPKSTRGLVRWPARS
jgi:transposase